MHKQLLRLIVITLVTLTVLPNYVHAQTDMPPGVDIVFIVDQSGSMRDGSLTYEGRTSARCKADSRATGCREPASDPQGSAIRSLKDAVDPIVEQIVRRSEGRLQSDLLPEEHRFGLVLFGGNTDRADRGVQEPVPLSRIEVQVDPDGMVHSNVDSLLPQQTTNLGETAFSRAFDAACTMLNCSIPPAPGRKRAVVLLTDGQPSQDDIDGSFDENNSAAADRYYAELRRRHEDLFKSADMWVLGLDQRNVFWPRNKSYWEQIAPGRTLLVTDPKDIADIFRKIASTEIGQPPGQAKPCDGTTFKVEPYKATLTLILEYPDTDSKAEFKLPDKQPLSKDTANLRYTRSSQSETFIIKNPVPGEWTCQITGTGVQPQFRDIQGVFTLAKVTVNRFGNIPASTCRDFNLLVSYYDKDNNKIVELPDYPLEQNLIITIDGQPITRKLVAEGSGHNQWHIDGAIDPGVKGGSYPVSVNVRWNSQPIFPDPENPDTSKQTVTIDPRLPCMRISVPTDGSTSTMHKGLSLIGVDVAVQLTQGMEPGTPTGVFREGLDQLVTGVLQGPNNISRTVQLQPSADTPGLFTARISDVPTQGDYHFTAKLKGTTQDGGVYELAPQTTNFKRVPGPGPMILRIVVLLLIVIGGVLLGLFVLRISPPRPKGTLVFEERTTGALAAIRDWEMIGTISLSGHRWLKLFRDRWPTITKRLPKQLGIRKLKVRRKGEGVRMVVMREKGRSSPEISLIRDNDRQLLDGKYRITYQNPSATGTKRRP